MVHEGNSAMSRPTEDAEVMVAVEVIEDLLCMVPPEKRIEVLNRAVAAEEAARKERQDVRC
jgi:hypothetical protein